MIKYSVKETWGGRGLFYLTLSGNNPSLREVKAETWSGEEPGAASEAEARGNSAYHPFPMAYSAWFPIHLKTTCLWWNHPQWFLPFYINHWLKKIATVLPRGHSNGGILTIVLPFSCKSSFHQFHTHTHTQAQENWRSLCNTWHCHSPVIASFY